MTKNGKKTTANISKRPPIVAVMGHIDHGKSTLLDFIRKSHVVDNEAGGITQHLSAYVVKHETKDGNQETITFLDTPGHSAFQKMRLRGADVADIAILVVSAEDGVMPQTIEALECIKQAKIPFIVAINKIDKPDADVLRTKTDLSAHGLIAEDFGGDVPMVEISAKENINIDKLLDVLLLVADVNDASIKADPSIPAIGTIIESHVDSHTGPVATVLIQAGTLRKNDKLVVDGEIYGKVRAMKDYNGDTVLEAGPSFPAQIIGFKVAPEVGDVLDLRHASEATKIDVKSKKTQQTGAQRSYSIENKSDDEGKLKKTFNIVLRADVLGSLEAIIGSLEKLKHDEVGVKIIGKGLGNLTEDDVAKAESGEAVLVGFNVKPSESAESILREKKVEFKKFSIIYDLLDWINVELEKLLEFEIIITEHGTMKVKGIFHTTKKQMIVGGLVTKGKVRKDTMVRVIRDGEHIATGKLLSCKIGQQDEKFIPEGSEGGILFEGKEKIEVDDVLESYSEEKRIRKLE